MFGWNETALFSQFVSVALKSAIVFGVAWLVTLGLRRRSAALRHLVWTAAASAALALPFLSVSLPALHVPGRVLPNVVFSTTTIDGPANVTSSSTAAPIHLTQRAAWSSTHDWRLWLMLLWIAGAVIALAQMTAGYAMVWRTRRSAQPFRDSRLCSMLTHALGIRRHVEVLESAPGSMPMTFGLLKSAIFMPSDAAGWTEERRRIVLLHELAHIRRGDVWSHWLTRTAVTLYWWNPLAWKAWREFLKERERAADDLVLAAGTSASGYASHLLAVATAMSSSPSIGWAAVAMARKSQLEGRLVAILDADVNRSTPSRAFAAAAMLTAAIVVAPLAAVRAQDNATVPADLDSAIRVAASQKNYEMLDDVAKAAEKQGKLDTAKQVLEPALDIRAEKAGTQSTEYAIGLLKLGDLDSLRGNITSATDFYTRAVQILGDKPESTRALLALGKNALKVKEYSQAMAYFERAQNSDPKNPGMALMWTAVAQQRQNNVSEAETLYKNALSRLNPSSTDAVGVMLVYANFLREQNRIEEANSMQARALDTQKANAVTPKLPDSAHRMSVEISAPKVLTKAEPGYSEDARLAKLSGTVLVSIVVGTDGTPGAIQVVRGLGLGLDEKAAEAIGKWTFQPGTKDGQAVPVAATIEVNFRLL